MQVAYGSCESASERRNALVQFLGTDSDHRFGVSSSKKKTMLIPGSAELNGRSVQNISWSIWAT